MSERIEPPWADLDDGIRETVRALWRSGYETTDSGDGRRTGAKSDMDNVLDEPHVFMVCDPGRMIDEADRLHAMVSMWGVDEDAINVQASYSPSDGVAVLMLFGVDDETVRKAIGARRAVLS